MPGKPTVKPLEWRPIRQSSLFPSIKSKFFFSFSSSELPPNYQAVTIKRDQALDPTLFPLQTENRDIEMVQAADFRWYHP